MNDKPLEQPCPCCNPELRRIREHYEIVDQKLKEQGTPGRFPESEKRDRRPEFRW